MSDVKLCPKCKPPKIEDTSSDTWTCPACGLNFKLDMPTRAWYPDAWWVSRPIANSSKIPTVKGV